LFGYVSLHHVTAIMPPRRYVVQDLKARIPVLFYEQGFTVKEICKILGIQKSLAYSSLAYFKTYGTTLNPYAFRKIGRRRLLNLADLKFVSSLIRRRHTIYLDEIQHELYQYREIHVSVPTLCRTLHRLALTRKVVSAYALERDDLIRSAFMNTIADEVPDPRMLMFVDEAARNQKTSQWLKGWALLGKKCVQRRFFVRGERFSILPILTLDGIITYDVISGSVSSERFVQFLYEMVVS
jgi:transposase